MSVYTAQLIYNCVHCTIKFITVYTAQLNLVLKVVFLFHSFIVLTVFNAGENLYFEMETFKYVFWARNFFELETLNARFELEGLKYIFLSWKISHKYSELEILK